MIRTAIRNIGEPILKWRAQRGRRSTFFLTSNASEVRSAIQVTDRRREHKPDRVDDRAPDWSEEDTVMIASASVTENGAEATIANTRIASGIANGPS